MKYMDGISPPRIFIINDSVTDCHSLSTSLLRAGYRVDFSANGRDGLTCVLEDPPQCLILNAILPDMSGYAVCRHVRAANSPLTVPIIIMSIKNTPLDQNYSLRMGANYYLPKPFTEELFLLAVKKMLPGFTHAANAQTPPPFTALSDPLAAFSPPEEYTFIPYRQKEGDIMLTDNPFARSSIMSNEQLRRLYTAVDGHRNVQKLAALMHLDQQSTLKLLKTLWQQQHIAFYDSKRRSLKKISIFDSMK